MLVFRIFWLLCVPFLLAPMADGQLLGGAMELLRTHQGTQASESFGSTVASIQDIDGDGIPELVAAAPYFDAQGVTSAGAVFVYSGASGNLIYQLEGTAAWDNFGRSLCVGADADGDGIQDIIVGAPSADPGGLNGAGSVYLFSGATGTIIHQWDGQNQSDGFGISVALVGDLNQSGFSDVAIGANRFDPNGAIDAGAVFLYDGLTGAQLFQVDGLAAADGFGATLLQIGDLDGDSIPDFLASAQGTSLFNPIVEYVQALSGANGVLLYQLDAATSGDSFGAALGAAGDLDGDSINDYLVGAPDAIGSASLWKSGTVTLVSGATGVVLAFLEGNAAFERFGSAVNTAGDINVDGTPDFLVGVPNANSVNGVQTGLVLLYSGSDFSQLSSFAGVNLFDGMGTSVVSLGDWTGDGLPELGMSAPSVMANGLAGAGEIYVYSRNPFLTATTTSISVGSTNLIGFVLDFPSNAGLDEYKILFSSSGTAPFQYGVSIPLTLDGMVLQTFFGQYPFPYSSGMTGTLGMSGQAVGHIGFPANSLAGSYVGLTLWAAAVVNKPAQLPEYSSMAIPLTVVP